MELTGDSSIAWGTGLEALQEEPRGGVWRLVGLLRYIGKMIMFASFMVFVPGLYSLYTDLRDNFLGRVDWLFLMGLSGLFYAALFLSRGGQLTRLTSLMIVVPIALVVGWHVHPLTLARLSDLTIAFNLYGALMLAIGYLLSTMTGRDISLRLEEAIFLVALLWILIPPLVAVPLYLYLGIPFINVWFESVNGMSGTGLTVFTGEVDPHGYYVPTVEQLPKPILLWRSLIQWVGGIGIVVTSMAVLARPGLGVILLSQVEGRLERIEPSIRKTSVQMVKFYVALTLLSFTFFMLAGMPLFDSVAHALTGISTAGFSTRNESIGGFNSVAIEMVAIIVMFIGASNFYDMYKSLKRPSFFFKSVELRFMLALTIVGVAVGFLILLYQGGEDPYNALRASAFQVVSGLTTTGFQSYDLSQAPVAFKFMLTVFMLIGGSVFSTAGGIKLFRIIVAFKAFKEEIRKITGPPGTVPTYRVGRYELGESDVLRAVLVTILFLLIANLGMVYTMLRLSSLHDIDDIYFDTISALTNIGLSAGVAGASLPDDVKLLFMSMSTLGRLEVLPLLVLSFKIVKEARNAPGKIMLLIEKLARRLSSRPKT